MGLITPKAVYVHAKTVSVISPLPPYQLPVVLISSGGRLLILLQLGENGIASFDDLSELAGEIVCSHTNVVSVCVERVSGDNYS